MGDYCSDEYRKIILRLTATFDDGHNDGIEDEVADGECGSDRCPGAGSRDGEAASDDDGHLGTANDESPRGGRFRTRGDTTAGSGNSGNGDSIDSRNLGEGTTDRRQVGDSIVEDGCSNPAGANPVTTGNGMGAVAGVPSRDGGGSGGDDDGGLRPVAMSTGVTEARAATAAAGSDPLPIIVAEVWPVGDRAEGERIAMMEYRLAVLESLLAATAVKGRDVAAVSSPMTADVTQPGVSTFTTRRPVCFQRRGANVFAGAVISIMAGAGLWLAVGARYRR